MLWLCVPIRLAATPEVGGSFIGVLFLVWLCVRVVDGGRVDP